MKNWASNVVFISIGLNIILFIVIASLKSDLEYYKGEGVETETVTVTIVKRDTIYQTSDPIYIEIPVPVPALGDPIDIALLDSLMALPYDSLIADLAIAKVYNESVGDSVVTVDVEASVSGRLLDWNITYDYTIPIITEMITVETTITETIRVKDKFRVWLGLEVSIPGGRYNGNAISPYVGMRYKSLGLQFQYEISNLEEPSPPWKVGVQYFF